MAEIFVVISQCMKPYMTEISVEFTIFTAVSLDPGMHFCLEVIGLSRFTVVDNNYKTTMCIHVNGCYCLAKKYSLGTCLTHVLTHTDIFHQLI